MSKLLHKILAYFGFRQTPSIALQIGASVKILQLNKTKSGKICIEHFAIENGPLVDKSSTLRAIKDAIQQSKSAIKKVCIGLSSQKIFIKNIKLPQLTSSVDVLAELELEIDKYIPYPIESIMFDYYVMDAEFKNPQQKLEVMLAAALKTDIEELLTLTKSANLVASRVDSTVYAIARAFEELIDKPVVTGQTFTLIDIDLSIFIIIIIKNQRIIYAHQTNLDNDKDMLIAILNLFRNAMQMLSIDNISALYLFGTKTKILELQLTLQQSLTIPVIVPSFKVKFDLASDVSPTVFAESSLALMQCYGLALGEIQSCIQ